MRLKGLDVLQAHVPDLNTTWGLWRVPLSVLGVFLLTCLFFLAADRSFAEWMPDGEIVVLALGFLILSRFFSQQSAYQHRYGEAAYQHAFARFCVPGLGIVTASVAHLSYIAGPDIPNVWWRAWLEALGALLVIVGLLLWFRSVTTLGLDSLVMLYVYYPAEGKRANVPIYELLRHPIYSATLDLGIGLALLHANWYALLVAVLLPLFFAGWVRLVEEPELLQRFPDYVEYRRRVPAFTPKPANAWNFIRYLLTGTAQPADHVT